MRPSKGGGSGNLIFWGVYSLFYIGKEFFWHHKFQWAHDPFCFLVNYFLTDTSFRWSMRCFWTFLTTKDLDLLSILLLILIALIVVH